MTDHGEAPHGLTEREREMYRLRVVNRWTLSKIAEKFEISPQRVHQILESAKDRLPPIDLAAVRRQSIELQEQVQRMALELAEMQGAPVTAGKDGMIVRETLGDGTEVTVRDYSGRVAALRLAQDADREIRKLLGADAATKVESTATVKYVVEGVNTDALT